MAITASQVNKLRQKSGAGMMDCKKALVEADGDFEKAIDLLRKTCQKMAAKRGDKDAKDSDDNPIYNLSPSSSISNLIFCSLSLKHKIPANNFISNANTVA